MPRKRQATLFDGARMGLGQAVDRSVASLRDYGARYSHWAVAYSGGKDSSATVSFVAWAILSGKVPAPKSLTVLYADTRVELPPLQIGAQNLLKRLSSDGFNTSVVVASMNNRFMVYMLGRGVPPPSNTFRWCTDRIKLRPMEKALEKLRDDIGEKLLVITGVRLGESAVRDQRIHVSCSRDAGECGQGWFQKSKSDAIADTLAPLVHWRLCHVYDWLYFDPLGHGYEMHGVADVYGEDEVRTGCIGCPLASRDISLERVVRTEKWSYLSPLLELKPLWAELKKPLWRKRKAEPETRRDGKLSKTAQRMGPLTMAGREYGLERVLDIQKRAKVDILNIPEEIYIRELWAMDTWPRKWSKYDIDAAELIPRRTVSNGQVFQQDLLFGG